MGQKATIVFGSAFTIDLSLGDRYLGKGQRSCDLEAFSDVDYGHVFFCPIKVYCMSFLHWQGLEYCLHPEGIRMSSTTALLVVDVQESFRHRPYWCDSDVPSFVNCLRSLIAGAQSRNIPVVQIFHVEDSGPFSLESDYVVPLQDLSFTPDAVFRKRSHSALIGSGLDVWLTQHGIRRVIISGIRSEQCCETTTRHAC